MEKTFLDELLEDEIEREQELSIASLDLILLEIKNLEKQISDNFNIAKEEQSYIADWAIRKNSSLSDKKEFLEKKLESFFNEQDIKTLDLANGRLQKRRSSVRLEVIDLELFMEHATDEMLSLQPEKRKPDLNKIKLYWTRSRKIPLGMRLIEPIEKFSIKLKQNGA